MSRLMLLICCDCHRKKPCSDFSKSDKTGKRLAWCRKCGVKRKGEAAYRVPKLDMSILGK